MDGLLATESPPLVEFAFLIVAALAQIFTDKCVSDMIKGIIYFGIDIWWLLLNVYTYQNQTRVNYNFKHLVYTAMPYSSVNSVSAMHVTTHEGAPWKNMPCSRQWCTQSNDERYSHRKKEKTSRPDLRQRNMHCGAVTTSALCGRTLCLCASLH